LVPTVQVPLVLRPSTQGVTSLDELEASVPLLNVGRTTVRVLSVDSGCGCARPRVEPRVVGPGQTARLVVRAASIPTGERAFAVVVHTDASAQPELRIPVRVVGSRPPPYLHAASGELLWHDLRRDDPREFVIETVERRSEGRVASATTVPSFRSILAGLELAVSGHQERVSQDEPDVVHHWYFVEARWKSLPDDGQTVGTVDVIDPWDPSRVISVSVMATLSPPVRIAPERLLLGQGRPGDALSTAKFAAIGRDPAERVELELIDTDDSPFVVSRCPGTQSAGPVEYSVQPKSGRTLDPGLTEFVCVNSGRIGRSNCLFSFGAGVPHDAPTNT
jgi:hypothetical protein